MKQYCYQFRFVIISFISDLARKGGFTQSEGEELIKPQKLDDGIYERVIERTLDEIGCIISLYSISHSHLNQTTD